MEKDELFKLKLSEAKDNFIDTKDSVRKTQAKIFYLFGFMFLLLSTVSVDILNGIYDTPKSFIFYITFFTIVLMVVNCWSSINPIKMFPNGLPPSVIEKIEESKIHDSILIHYESATAKMNTRLESLSNDYKICLKTVLTLGLFLPVFLLFLRK